jgi:hypothetical protein
MMGGEMGEDRNLPLLLLLLSLLLLLLIKPVCFASADDQGTLP